MPKDWIFMTSIGFCFGFQLRTNKFLCYVKGKKEIWIITCYTCTAGYVTHGSHHGSAYRWRCLCQYRGWSYFLVFWFNFMKGVFSTCSLTLTQKWIKSLIWLVNHVSYCIFCFRSFSDDQIWCLCGFLLRKLEEYY